MALWKFKVHQLTQSRPVTQPAAPKRPAPLNAPKAAPAAKLVLAPTDRSELHRRIDPSIVGDRLPLDTSGGNVARIVAGRDREGPVAGQLHPAVRQRPLAREP